MSACWRNLSCSGTFLNPLGGQDLAGGWRTIGQDRLRPSLEIPGSKQTLGSLKNFYVNDVFLFVK